MDRLPKELIPHILSYSAWDPCRRVCTEWRNFMIKEYGEESYFSCRRPLSLKNHNYQIGVTLGIFFLKYHEKYIYWALVMNILNIVIDNKKVTILRRSFFETKEITFIEGIMVLEISKETSRIRESLSGFQWGFIIKKGWFNGNCKNDILKHGDILFFPHEEKLFVLSERALIKEISCKKRGEYISYKTEDTFHWLKIDAHLYEKLFDSKLSTHQIYVSVLFITLCLFRTIGYHFTVNMAIMVLLWIYLIIFRIHDLYARLKINRRILFR